MEPAQAPANAPAAHQEDLEHLRLLSIFHYVVAGLIALFSLFPLIHLVLGIGMLTGGFAGGPDEGEARMVGAFFVVFAGCWILFGLACAAAVAMAGVYLKQHRKYLYCLVVAGVSCMFMPFGTVLGVFTILVLMRDSVKRLFGRPPAAGEAAPATP